MKNLKRIFFVLCFGSTYMAFSQEIESIQADRPDQTETPFVTPKGMFQMEVGFTYQKNEGENRNFSLPSVLWKYGINEHFEWRIITEYAKEKSMENQTSGISPVAIGCKIKISEEKGIWPKTSFIGHLSFPNLASKSYKINVVAPNFRFTMQHTLSSKLTLGYNMGAEWDGISPEPTYIYTLTTGYSFTKHLGSYVEIFGFAPQSEVAYHSLDGGFTYLLSDNFMLDASAGFGLTPEASRYYLALGTSFRI